MAAAGMMIGMVSGIAGGIMGMIAADKAEKAQKAQIRLQQQNEVVRETAAKLDAQRRKREMVREQIITQSLATSAATQQNSQYGTLLPGTNQGTAAQTAQNVTGVNNQLLTAQDIFANNRRIGFHKMEEAEAQKDMAMAQGISSIGGAIGRSLGSIGRLGG